MSIHRPDASTRARATLSEVASLADVSVSTVSKVLDHYAIEGIAEREVA